MNVSGPLSRTLRAFAQRAWRRAGTHGDRAFLVVASSYWNEPQISQHDIARTFAQRGPTIFLDPAWKGNRTDWGITSKPGDPVVVSGPAIPRGVRFGHIARLNMILGLATWRALVDAAPGDHRLVIWALEFRFAPVLRAEGYWPPFIFHNVDIQTDGTEEARMARLARLTVCPSSAAADVLRVSNPRTIAIGHGVTRQLAELAAVAASQRAASSVPTRTLGFVGLWNPAARIDTKLVEQVLSTEPDLILEVTATAESIVDIAGKFPGRVRPLGILTWPEILQRSLTWDAALVPYDVTRPHIYYSCPYKIFPLLSAGLPVISVDILAIRGLAPHLYVARRADEFVAAAQRAVRGELRSVPADARAFREARVWDRILDHVIDAYDDSSRPTREFQGAAET